MGHTFCAFNNYRSWYVMSHDRTNRVMFTLLWEGSTLITHSKNRVIKWSTRKWESLGTCQCCTCQRNKWKMTKRSDVVSATLWRGRNSRHRCSLADSRRLWEERGPLRSTSWAWERLRGYLHWIISVCPLLRVSRHWSDRHITAKNCMKGTKTRANWIIDDYG